MTRNVKLVKTTHNGLVCYKDETSLYMVIKVGGKWEIVRANEHNDDLINETRAWGYGLILRYCKTLKEAKIEIEDDIELGVWFDDYQKDLKNKYYLG